MEVVSVDVMVEVEMCEAVVVVGTWRVCGGGRRWRRALMRLVGSTTRADSEEEFLFFARQDQWAQTLRGSQPDAARCCVVSSTPWARPRFARPAAR